jgi:hypothetical protein
MGTKSYMGKNIYRATIDDIDFEIPIDKEGFLMIPDMNKKGEVICKIKKSKFCDTSLCLGVCHAQIEKIICKRIVEQRNKTLINA